MITRLTLNTPRRGLPASLACLALGLSLSGCSFFGFMGAAEDEQAAIDRSMRKVAESSQLTHDYVSAARHFESLYNKNPKDVDAALGLARNLRYAGTPKRAVMVLDRSLKTTPNNPHLLAEQGRALIASGNSQAAIPPLTQALKIGVGTDDWRTYSALGIAHDQLGRHDAARAAYDKARLISPENTTILNNLALSLAMSEQLDEAVGLLELAQKLPGTTAQVRQNLALLYGMRGDDRRAYELARLDLPEATARENVRFYVSLREGAQSGDAIPDGPDLAKYSIQVGAYASPALAEEAWRNLQRNHSDLLSTFQAEVFDKKDGGNTPYVVWAGPVNNVKAATRLCNAMRSRKANCLVVMK